METLAATIKRVFTFNDSLKLSPRRTNEKWAQAHGHEALWEQIIDATSFLDHDCTFQQRYYHIKYNLDHVPECPYCDGICKFNGGCYTKTCSSRSCKRKHSKIINAGDKNPQFGKKQSQETKKARIQSRRSNGKPWHTDKSRQQIRRSNIITHTNPEWQETDRQRRIKAGSYKKQSDTLKKKIASGEFTPCVTNSWANSRVKIELDGFEKKYRSSWDAAFQVLNPLCEYEKVRIVYKIDDEEHVYLVDFVDEQQRVIYEIKPRSMRGSKTVRAKREAAIRWCEKNDFEYVEINEHWFQQHAHKIDYACYNDKLKHGMRQFL